MIDVVEDERNMEAFLELFARLAAPEMPDVLYVEIGQLQSAQVVLGAVN